METPLLLTAANGHNFLTFEAYDTPQWHAAVEWLTARGFSTRPILVGGTPIIGLDEGILPSYVRGEISIAAGWDNWSGNYLLAENEQADSVLAELASHVAAKDRRSAA